MKQIELAGLLWDVENFQIGSRKYFTYDEARKIAKMIGKRLPTEEEFKSLTNFNRAWDHKSHGCWFGIDAEKLGKSDYSIFFPAWGYGRYDIEARKIASFGGVRGWGEYLSESNGLWLFRKEDYRGWVDIEYRADVDQAEFVRIPFRCVEDIAKKRRIQFLILKDG